MDAKYGGVIWTKHALQRLKDRGISQGDAWATWRRPDNSQYATQKNAWVYYRRYGNQQIEVVATKNDNSQWVILSVWSKPVIHRQKKPKQGILKWFIKKLSSKSS